MEFTGSFRVDKADNIRFNYHLVHRKHWITCAAILVILTALVTLIDAARSGGFNANALLRGALFGLLGAVLWTLYILYFKIWAPIGKMYKTGRLKPFTQQITMSDKGIHAVTGSGENDIRYKDILKVEETPTDFYLYMNDTFAYLMNKKQLPHAEDVVLIRKLFQARLPQEKLKLRA